jgi:hypothetical protein
MKGDCYDACKTASSVDLDEENQRVPEFESGGDFSDKARESEELSTEDLSAPVAPGNQRLREIVKYSPLVKTPLWASATVLWFLS